jgi:hypothetical protein
MNAPTKTDYTAFLALFDQEQQLFLTDHMQVTPQARTALEQVSDTCLTREKSALPDGSIITLTNRLDVFAHKVPYVRLQAEDGVLLLPAYRFLRLLPIGILRGSVCAVHTDARCSGCQSPLCRRHNAAPGWMFDLYCPDCRCTQLSIKKEA